MERTEPISRHTVKILATVIITATVIVFIAQTLLGHQGTAQPLARRKQKAAAYRSNF